MSNKLLVPLCWISLLAMLAGLTHFLYPSHELLRLQNLSGWFFLMGTTYLLLKNDNFLTSRYYKWAAVAMPLLLFGVLFRVMHWPWGSLMLHTALFTICICYLLYFLDNKNKTTLDWVKVIFVISFTVSRLYKLLRLPYGEILTIGSFVLLIYALILFSFPEKKEGPDVLDN